MRGIAVKENGAGGDVSTASSDVLPAFQNVIRATASQPWTKTAALTSLDPKAPALAMPPA